MTCFYCITIVTYPSPDDAWRTSKGCSVTTGIQSLPFYTVVYKALGAISPDVLTLLTYPFDVASEVSNPQSSIALSRYVTMQNLSTLEFEVPLAPKLPKSFPRSRLLLHADAKIGYR